MKKLFIASLLAGIISIFSLSASAAPYQVEVGDMIQIYDWNDDYRVMAGGMVFKINGTIDADWMTFCLQQDATTYTNRVYQITYIGEGYSDYLLKDRPNEPRYQWDQNNWNQVAWLYQSFMEGTLDNFHGSQDDQSALQYAIWMLTLDVTSSPFSGTSSYLEQARIATGPGSDYYNRGNVMVAVNGGQDVLVYSAAPVPEPATMLLLGTGLIGLAGVGRKKFLKYN